MIYNIVVMINKEFNSYTNLTKEEFFDKLWEWTYEDDLWDFMDEACPTKEDLLTYLDNVFIDENIFHKFDADDVSCYAFCVDVQGTTNITTSIFEYNWNQELEDYVINKVLERYREGEDGEFIKNSKENEELVN